MTAESRRGSQWQGGIGKRRSASELVGGPRLALGVETLRARGSSALRSVPYAIGLSVILGTLASSVRADDGEDLAAAPRGRLGVGLGGSWLPGYGDTTTLVARVSAGFDVGRFSLSALPTFQYVAVTKYPSPTMSAGYLAIENALRITPGYALSIAPLVGYAHSPDPDPGCSDVCYAPLGNGWLLGADVSPATFVFGRDGAFEVGLHGSLFEFPKDGQVMLGAYLELRWIFAQRTLRVASPRLRAP
jgi:hypothetical protein